MTEIKYSPRDIFEQDFKTAIRGYSKEEVDEFLDDVIKDYEKFARILEDLRTENKKLQAKLRQKADTAEPFSASVGTSLMSESTAPQVGSATEKPRPATATTAVTNFDILKRISRLEKEVFGKQIIE